MESRVMLHQSRYATAAGQISPSEAAQPVYRPDDRDPALAPVISKPNLVFLNLCAPDRTRPGIIRQLYPERVFGEAPIAIIASDPHQDEANSMHTMRFLGYHYDASLQASARALGAQRFAIESRGFYEKLLLQQFKEILLASHQLNHDLRSYSEHRGYLQALLLFDRKQKNEYHFPMVVDDLDLAQEMLVELVEFCPSCLQYDIRLNYACPTCRSLNLKSSVSLQNLSVSFECQQCGRRLKHPPMRGRCRRCNKQFPSDKFIFPKLYWYEFDDGKLMINAKLKPKPTTSPAATDGYRPAAAVDIKSAAMAAAQPNYLPLAFREAKVSYIPPTRCLETLNNEINLAVAKKEEITVMSVKLPNLPLLYAMDDTKVMVSIYKAIIYYISDFLRFRDAMSFNLEQQKIFVILPATPLKLAKIIARKIINQLYQFRQYFQVDIHLASFPQDGKTADEILAMLELGLEKVQFEQAM